MMWKTNRFSRIFYRSRWITATLLIISFFSCLWLFEFMYEPKPLVEYVERHFEKHNECKNIKHVTRISTNEAAKKVILFYTLIFQRIPLFHPEELQCCEPFNCEITRDKSRLLQSDAVVFHGRDLPTAGQNTGHMPKQRKRSQRWIYYSMECPYNAKIIASEYNNIFNWTMTYERQSDIYVPYGFYTKKIDADEQMRKMKNFAEGKDKLVVYVNSHCKTFDGLRENFVRALNKIIKVDVFGECGGIFGRVACPRWTNNCARILKRYKFYISLENNVCNDYITEKYWNVPFSIDAVPIVFGLSFFKELAIPGSYIDATSFKSLHELVAYIEYLNTNDTAYNEYFIWREHYQLANLEPWPCRLCRMLHNNSLPVKTYKNFDQYLDPARGCKELSQQITF